MTSPPQRTVNNVTGNYKLAQELTEMGVMVEKYEFSQRSVGRLATALVVAIRNRALALPHDPDLIRELARVRLRETAPGLYRLDHAAGDHDDRAVAIGLAVTTLRERAAAPGPRLRTLR